MKPTNTIGHKSSFSAGVAVAAFTFFSLIFIEKESLAATGSSWSKQSSWGADDNSSYHRSVRKGDLNSVSPMSPGSNNIALDLGQVFLMGDLTRFSDSLGFQLHYTYGVSDIFAFDSSAGYSEHSDGKFSMSSVLTGMRLNMSWYDKIIPYAIFGLGFYRPTYQDTTATPATPVLSNNVPVTNPSLSAVLFGVHLGPGIDLELNKNLFFGAALTFHNMFGTTKNLANGAPLNLGGAYSSFFLHLGATF